MKGMTMKNIVKNALVIGKILLSHKGTLLLGLGALAAAGISSRIVAFRRKRRDSTGTILEAPRKTPNAEPENATRYSRKSKRAVYQAPQIPAQNLVPH